MVKLWFMSAQGDSPPVHFLKIHRICEIREICEK